ncbi:efflux RND transporter periplasmic adaptor subunit [Legionella sp. W05-934-2]|uniref:efflux RND transporter periplasmic adaptor subunit n=1 Tax=Legionella sp. W05-934-2 TaxID=1198649 RepID=UPI003462198F
MRINHRHWIGIVALAGLVFVFGLWVFKNRTQPSDSSSTSIPVETSKTQLLTMADKFETVGNLESTDQIDISSEYAGQIKAIRFTAGSDVKRGQLLIELDDTMIKNEMATAKHRLALSESNYERINKLAQRRMASDQSLEELKTDWQEKKNAYLATRAQLNKLKIKAPFEGTLGDRHISVGQYIKVGEPLVKLVAQNNLKLQYHLPERYLANLGKGQKVVLETDAFPNQQFSGQVTFIDPTLDPATRSIRIEAEIPNTDHRLLPGMFVRLTHSFGNDHARLFVPEESLIPTINGQKIFIAIDKQAKSVMVQTGIHHKGMTEITKGLDADSLIITRGQHRLKDGANIIDVGRG